MVKASIKDCPRCNSSNETPIVYVPDSILTIKNGKEISLFPSYHYVLTTDASESGADGRSVNGLSNTMSESKQVQAVSSISTSNTFAFCPGEDQLVEFDEGFYNTDIPCVEISKLVSDDSKPSSSSSSSSVSSSSGYIPRSIVRRIYRVDTYSNSTTDGT
ncbi:hypothetical protein ACTFIV_007909 [Dictyostelium citrinum]